MIFGKKKDSLEIPISRDEVLVDNVRQALKRLKETIEIASSIGIHIHVTYRYYDIELANEFSAERRYKIK